jgi:RNA polymerase sigma factor (sigma-70 family)
MKDVHTVSRDFGDFYAQTKDAVFRAVLLSLRNPERAEDAVAEAYARAYAMWSKLQEHPNLVGWTIRTALNYDSSMWRIRRREMPNPPDAAVSVDGEDFDPDLLEHLWGLSKRQRQVVALRILLDLSEQESGRILRISPKTVSVHLHRALRDLREALVKNRQGESTEWTTRRLPTR